MTGTATWVPKEIAFIRAVLFAKLAMAAILVEFNGRFPAHNPKHKVAESSITYCRTQYIDREEYNPDIWLSGFPGKRGYLLALIALGLSTADIIKRIEERYPSHKWPGIERENQPITKSDAVEIAVATCHEYAGYYGKESLLSKYPDRNAPLVQEVLLWHEALQIKPNFIADYMVRTIGYDDVIFILTRFLPGFADRYLHERMCPHAA